MAQDPRVLLQKAEKLHTSASSGFALFGGREQKFLDAADYYVQAANAFRLQKCNIEAGQAFEKAASIQKNDLNEPDDAANTMTEAFKVYRKESPKDAARCLDKAIVQYCARGNFRRAAKQKEDLGELFEKDIQDRQRAIECYENAALWYDGDNAQTLANKNWLRVGDLAALDTDYHKAIEQFEKVAEQSINSNLMRYSVKDYFLKAGLCHLASGDVISARRAREQYCQLDPSFAAQRENQLLKDLICAVEEGNLDAFSARLFDYDAISKLDVWKTTVLLQIKSQIEEADNEFS